VPRAPRSVLPDYGYFHVTCRGVGGSHIFVDDADREAFVRLLRQASRRFGWRLHAWCLMGTHFHIVVEGPREALSGGMHRLNGLYAQRFNRRYARRGHLFEERFRSWVVEGEAYFWATVNYVLENPVRAGLCDDPRDWFWSTPHNPFVAAPSFPAASLRARSEGLSLGPGHDDHVDPAGTVDADDELLLDVGAPARTRHDRQSARQLTAERLEELGEPRQDRVLRDDRHVRLGKE